MECRRLEGQGHAVAQAACLRLRPQQSCDSCIVGKYSLAPESDLISGGWTKCEKEFGYDETISLQLARSDDEVGQKEDLRNLQTQLRQAVAVVKALNERLTEQLSVTNDIEAKKAQAETRIQELEDQYLDHRREADTFRRQTALLQKELAKEIATRRSAQKSVLQLQAQIIASQKDGRTSAAEKATKERVSILWRANKRDGRKSEKCRGALLAWDFASC